MSEIVNSGSCNSIDQRAINQIQRKNIMNMNNNNEEEEEQQELWFLNNCMSKAEQVHVLVCNSLCKEEVTTHNSEELTNAHSSSTLQSSRSIRSFLLSDDVQTYFRYLLHKYRDGKLAQRRKVSSSRCFYFLECLTNEALRDEFILAASSTRFADL